MFAFVVSAVVEAKLSIGLLVGILCFCFHTCLSNVIFLVITVPLILLICAKASHALRLLIYGVVLGVVLSAWHYQLHLRHRFPRALQNKVIRVQGEVSGLLKQEDNQTIRFALKVAQYQHAHATTNLPAQLQPTLLLYWRHPPFDIKPHQHLRLMVKVKLPHGTVNFVGFNKSLWAYANNIDAIGSVKAGRCLSCHGAVKTVTSIRQGFMQYILRHQQADPHRGILVALATGDRQWISFKEWQVFQNTGTSHLVAISGLHVSMVAAIMLALFSLLWWLNPRLGLLLPRQLAGIVPALCAAITYSAFTGFALTTSRACMMLVVMLGMKLWRRQIHTSRAIAVALFVVLCLHPFAVLQISFWLSFYAVTLLSLCASGHDDKGLVNKLLAHSKWTLGFAPIVLFAFGKLSLVGSIANIIAIPMIACIALPCLLLSLLSFMGHLPCAAFCLSTASYVVNVLWGVLHFLGGFSFAVWSHPLSHYSILVAAIIGVLLILCNQYKPWQFTGMMLFLPCVIWHPSAPRAGQLRVTVLDVGQGLSVVLQTAHHALVYDTGPKYGDHYNAGRRMVLPYLQSQGISKIDILMISHRDMDHIGGSNAVLTTLPVRRILTSVPARFMGWPVATCLRGQYWQWDNVQFRVLYPTPTTLHQDNNSSCVLQVEAGREGILLTGDIEKKAEQSILALSAEYTELHSQVLIAPHHGSKTSSSPAFIHAVQPHYVIYSTGYLNHFHLPSPLIVKRYEKRGVIGFDTQHTGAIRFVLTPHVIKQLQFAGQMRALNIK